MLGLARIACALFFLAGCARPWPQQPAREHRAGWVTLAGGVDGQPVTRDDVSARARAARGLYFSYPYMLRFGARGVRRTLSGARMDAAVLDVKDASGRISHRTRVRAFKPQVASVPLDLARMVRTLRANGIHTIARISCFADPSLSRREPARAIMDARREGKLWRSRSTEGTWLDPYNRDNHALIVALAREAEALGFDEVQLDYVRFPVDKSTAWAAYPAQVDTPRYRVLIELLRDVDAALSIPLGVDVFGLAAKNGGDPAGLGQSLEEWAPHVEVISPMLYVNGMKSWGHGSSRRAGMLIERLTGHLRERVGKEPVIRPYIQAFSAGADHWDPAFITEQIEGARLGQADGFLFWHPGSDYSMVTRGVRRMPEGLMPFPQLARKP
jgi:hypothetical protein